MKTFLKNLFLILSLIGIFYLGYNFSNQSANKREQRLVEEIRSQITTEVRSQLSTELRTQLKQELLAELQEKKSAEIQSNQLSKSENHPKETLEQAIKRVVQETIVKNNDKENAIDVSNEELDQYAAGAGVESELTIDGGYIKTPGMLLAKNEGSATKPKALKVKKQTKNDSSSAANMEKTESIERTLQQRGSMLLPKGKWVFDPSTSWAHFSSNKINLGGVTLFNLLTIGTIGTQEVNRDIFIQNFSLKYGLLNNFQAEIRIPFRGEHDSITNNNTSNVPINESTRSAFGIGDIDMALSRQIGWEHGLIPDLIASIGFKTVTGRSYGHDVALGSGHYSFRTALVAAKSSDPAVIFGSVSYTYNFERTGIDGIGDVKPGDSIGYSLGTAIALSYQTAINFSFDNSIVFKTTRNGQKALDSFLNVANFKAGFNWALDESKSVDFSVGMGLTKDSPDLSIEVGFPISF